MEKYENKRDSKNNYSLSEESTKRYHKFGDKLLLDGYLEMGIINEQQNKDIKAWLDTERENEYFKNTEEYHELKQVIENSETRYLM